MNELAKIHIAAKELGLSKEAYRDIIALNFPGKSSSKDLSQQQRTQLLTIFISRGWKPKSGTTVKQGRTATRRKDDNFIKISRTDANGRQKRYILALWNNLGYDVATLHARCKKQFNIDRFEWVTEYADLRILITDLQHRCRQAGLDPEA